MAASPPPLRESPTWLLGTYSRLVNFEEPLIALKLWSTLIFIIAFVLWLRNWLKGGVCKVRADLRGKTVVITGANAGIGKQTAVAMARMGATLILACRTRRTAEAATAEIKRLSGNDEVSLVDLDLASFASVKRCSVEISKKCTKIDILINNAGLMDVPFTVTEDGYELHFGANHLGHFLLTHLLLPRLKSAPNARIVNVASNSHIFTSGIDWDTVTAKSSAKYGRRDAYSQSKLANILFTAELARRVSETAPCITTYTLHPGVVATDILRHWPSWMQLLVSPFMRFIAKTAEQGAQTTIFSAIAPGIENLSGSYFADCKVRRASSAGRNAAEAKILFEKSESFIGRAFFDPPKDAADFAVPQAKKTK